MAAAVYRLGWTAEGMEVGQAVLVCVVAACFAHGAFLSGKHPLEPFSDRFKIHSWWEACRFWTWPCLTFALTYYLVQIGFIAFVEAQTQGGVSEGLTRCPFVMEILAKTGWVTSGRKPNPVEIR